MMLDKLVSGIDGGIRALSEAFAGPVHSYCKLETVDEGALVADDGSLRFTRVLGQYDPLDKTKALVFEAPVRLENASPEAVRLLEKSGGKSGDYHLDYHEAGSLT